MGMKQPSWCWRPSSANSRPWAVRSSPSLGRKRTAIAFTPVRARFVRISELIEALGLPNVGAPHVKHIRGPIWEIRLTGKSGIARALYVTALGPRVVVVRVFAKKTQRTPSSEIALALARAKELDT